MGTNRVVDLGFGRVVSTSACLAKKEKGNGSFEFSVTGDVSVWKVDIMLNVPPRLPYFSVCCNVTTATTQ